MMPAEKKSKGCKLRRPFLSCLGKLLLLRIVGHLDFTSILNLSATSHGFQSFFFPLAALISPFRPIRTMDYVPNRLTPVARISSLPNEIALCVMLFCDFESLRSLILHEPPFLVATAL